jgi:hypothetical protein
LVSFLVASLAFPPPPPPPDFPPPAPPDLVELKLAFGAGADTKPVVTPPDPSVPSIVY